MKYSIAKGLGAAIEGREWLYVAALTDDLIAFTPVPQGALLFDSEDEARARIPRIKNVEGRHFNEREYCVVLQTPEKNTAGDRMTLQKFLHTLEPEFLRRPISIGVLDQYKNFEPVEFPVSLWQMPRGPYHLRFDGYLHRHSLRKLRKES